MYLIVCLIWIGFGISHSFLISMCFSNWATRKMGHYSAFNRLAYNLFSLALFIFLIRYTRNLDSNLVIQFTAPWTTFQKMLYLLSGLLIVWALLSYDWLEFIGIRQIINIKAVNKQTHSEPLISKGLLGIIRHPMYLATILLMWSLNATAADIIAHSVLTIYIIIGIKLEERKLVKQFGSAYIEYQRKIPALIPFTKNKTAE